MNEIRSQLAGEFTGYDDGAIFRLDNGQVWQQQRYKYKYRYKYRPRVRIYQSGLRWLAEFDCMDEPVEVAMAHVIQDGCIVSEFSGFDGNSVFQFETGHVWRQDEYKYCYHYAFRPQAMVVDGVNGVVLHVEGMSDQVRVRRA